MKQDITGRASQRAAKIIQNAINRFTSDVMPLGPTKAELSHTDSRAALNRMTGDERVELSRMIGEERMLELMKNATRN